MINDPSESWHYQDPSTGNSVPVSRDELDRMLRNGALTGQTFVWSPSLTDWTMAAEVPRLRCLCGVSPPVPPSVRKDTDLFINRIADYYKVSAILWLIIAILQIVSILGIIAGIWNLFASASRFQMIKAVRARLPSVVEANKGIAQLVILGIINFFLGAVVGVLFVAFDFYIRDQVLKRANLFGGTVPASPTVDQSQAQNLSQQLEKLYGLRQSNVITESEYQIMKERLLN